jgi:hypothetical protein
LQVCEGREREFSVDSEVGEVSVPLTEGS